ncbi:MAG: PPC domain-containing DNA-binding protein [Dethiobacteria bacterium]|nr:DNA-binding protein [Bacillota bacterium]
MYLFYKYKQGRKWVARLPHDGDLGAELEKFAREQGIKVGRVEVIGAVKEAVIGFYDQEKKEYLALKLARPLEILNCSGNLSLKDGDFKVHLHITLGDRDGRSFGGHLMPGTILFAGEAVIEELEGPELHRGYDPQTGLPLWEKEH